MRTTGLDEAEAEALSACREEWLGVGLCTDPADRGMAEQGVAECYRAIGREPPGTVIWMSSPPGGCLGAACLANGDQLRDQLGDQLGDQLRGQLGGQLRDQLWGQLGDQLWGQLRGQLRGQLWGAWWGQWDSPWVAWWTFGKTVGASYPEHLELGRSGWEKIARSCSWWWPFEGAVVLTDRPSVIARDHEGELHRTDGPALAYRDGYGLWAVHGVRVKQQIVEAPETLKPEEILAEPNAEVRRVMIDRFGADRLMLSTNAEVRHRDIDRLGKPRELLRITVPGDEPICMVRVVNSSPEPDGDFREYLLRVPPEVESCEAAVAWTFGLGEAEYAPTVET